MSPAPVSNYRATPLIECIEYDWCVVVRCPACGHTTRWDADALVERFRDSLRVSVEDLAAKMADHCDGRRPAVYRVQGAGMLRDDRSGFERAGTKDAWEYRDWRLRRFLERHGLPLDLADERRAARAHS